MIQRHVYTYTEVYQEPKSVDQQVKQAQSLSSAQPIHFAAGFLGG